MSLTVAPARIVEESSSPLLATHESWERQPLGDVATILNGYAFASKEFKPDAGKPLIRIRDIFGDSTSVGFVGHYDERYLVQPGELLVGMDGDFNCARWRGPEALLNQRVCKVTPDPKRMDIGFLTHLLPGYLQAIHDVTSSTTVTHLSSRDVAQIPIPVPPLEQQRRIAHVLNLLCERRESSLLRLRTALRAVERFRQAVLAAACTGRLTGDWRVANLDLPSVEPALLELDGSTRRRTSKEQEVDLSLPELPDTYVVASVGAASVLLQYGTSQRLEASAEQGIPVLRMGNIQDGRLDLGDLKYRQLDTELQALLLEDGDLLFNRTNSPELVGKSAVHHGSEPMSFASYIIRVRFAPDVVLPDFVNYWINSAWGRVWARLSKTDGVSQSNINGSKLALMPLPLPPIEEQRVIVERASSMLDAAARLTASLEKAIRQVELSSLAVLAKAFRGELAIDSSEDRDPLR